jgi:alkylhydroperoxidase/carboxymuconolactone decarboxylase family protein YurZ
MSAATPPTPGLLDVILRNESLASAMGAMRGEVFRDVTEITPPVRELIVVALDLALRNGAGAALHARRAIDEGASPAMLREVIELCLYVCGPTALASVVAVSVDAISASLGG